MTVRGKNLLFFFSLLQFSIGAGLLQRELNTRGGQQSGRQPDSSEASLDIPALEDSGVKDRVQVRIGKANYWQALNADTYSLRKSRKTPWAKKLPRAAVQKDHHIKQKSTKQNSANPKPSDEQTLWPHLYKAKPVATPEKEPYFKPIVGKLENQVEMSIRPQPNAGKLSAAAATLSKMSGKRESHDKPDRRSNWEKLQDEWIVPEKPVAKPLISSKHHGTSKHHETSPHAHSAQSEKSRFAFPAPPAEKVHHKKRQAQKAPKKEVNKAPRGETVELCHKGNLHVMLNSDINVRQLTFGDNKFEPLVQTAVHCEGKPASSCFKKHHSKAHNCDLSANSCPCKFDMQALPPLDFEYNYIANRIVTTVDGQNQSGSAQVNSSHIALVGLGGGMLPQYLLEHKQSLVVDAIELDADVIDVARSFFGVANYESLNRLHVRHADGISALNAEQPGRYGITVVDCFGDGRLPAGCRSNEFVKAVYRSLTPGGEVLQNVILSRPDDKKLDQEVRNDFEELMTEYRAIFGPHAVALEAEVKGASNAVVRARKKMSA